jgi:hypothetical protein
MGSAYRWAKNLPSPSKALPIADESRESARGRGAFCSSVEDEWPCSLDRLEAQQWSRGHSAELIRYVRFLARECPRSARSGAG